MECCCLSWVLCDASVSWPERGRAGVTSWTAQSWSRDRGYLWGVAPKTVCKQGSVSVCSSTFFPLLFSIILIMSINISYYSDSICWIVNEIYCPIAVVLEEDLPKLERFCFHYFHCSSLCGLLFVWWKYKTTSCGLIFIVAIIFCAFDPRSVSKLFFFNTVVVIFYFWALHTSGLK